MKTLFRSLFLIPIFVLLSLSLSACGFHLKGALVFPSTMRLVYIKSDNPNAQFALIENIKSLLRANHIAIAQSENQATTVLSLSNLDKKQQTIAKSGNMQSGTYSYTISVDLHAYDQKSGLAYTIPNQVSASQNYQDNATLLLSTASTLAVLQKTIFKDLAQQILSVLSKAKLASSAKAS